MRCVVFFFQAEDGIRDVAVTGVQTCALPIYLSRPARALVRSPLPVCAAVVRRVSARAAPAGWCVRAAGASRGSGQRRRSEERRVGKSVDLGGRRIIKKKKNKKTE